MHNFKERSSVLEYSHIVLLIFSTKHGSGFNSEIWHPWDEGLAGPRPDNKKNYLCRTTLACDFGERGEDRKVEDLLSTNEWEKKVLVREYNVYIFTFPPADIVPTLVKI